MTRAHKIIILCVLHHTYPLFIFIINEGSCNSTSFALTGGNTLWFFKFVMFNLNARMRASLYDSDKIVQVSLNMCKSPWLGKFWEGYSWCTIIWDHLRCVVSVCGGKYQWHAFQWVWWININFQNIYLIVPQQFLWSSIKTGLAQCIPLEKRDEIWIVALGTLLGQEKTPIECILGGPMSGKT